MVITNHAAERMKERSGLNSKSLMRIANKVYEEGLKHSDLHGSLKRWVDGLYLSYRTANQMRLYGDKVYLFRGEILITIIQVPYRYTGLVKKFKNRSVTNGGTDKK